MLRKDAAVSRLKTTEIDAANVVIADLRRVLATKIKEAEAANTRSLELVEALAGRQQGGDASSHHKIIEEMKWSLATQV